MNLPSTYVEINTSKKSVSNLTLRYKPSPQLMKPDFYYEVGVVKWNKWFVIIHGKYVLQSSSHVGSVPTDGGIKTKHRCRLVQKSNYITVWLQTDI